MLQSNNLAKPHGHIVGKPFPVATFDGAPTQDAEIVLELLAIVSIDELTAAVEAAGQNNMAPLLENYGITNGSSFVEFIVKLLVWTPTEDFTATDVLDVICVFYYILDQAPVGGMQTPICPASAGQTLTPLSSWIVKYAAQVGLWMSNPQSLTPATYSTFKTSRLYEYKEWLLPNPNDPTGLDGFTSFNDFFGRNLVPGCRPIASPEDDTVIVFPADSHFDMSYPIGADSSLSVPAQYTLDKQIISKALVWQIQDLLSGSAYADQFTNGMFMHAFLDTYNYHCQHAPVAGTVKEAFTIQGAPYLDVFPTQDGTLAKRRTLAPVFPQEGVIFPTAGGEPQPDAEDPVGYQFLQSRGLIVIDNPTLGLVAVLPMGMAQVSSIVINSDITPGATVTKGQQISKFQFGGSDIVVVFQQQAGVPCPIPVPTPAPGRPYILVNSELVKASPTSS